MRARIGSALTVALTIAWMSCAACRNATSVIEGRGEAREGEVPIELVGPGDAALVVPVRINGSGPYDFILDTGATLTCVDTELAGELELPDATMQMGRRIDQEHGEPIRLVEIERLQVGSAEATQLTACTLNLQQLRNVAPDLKGLLGLNFLKAYRVVLDFERNVLKLEDPDQSAAASPTGQETPVPPSPQ